MVQQLTPKRGFAPLRVQRTFKRLDDGRGARAAALAEGLGVVLQAVPKIAERGSQEAFEAGMKARIDGVKRENAGAANKSMLGFMFSKRAQDGFDYQDAQMEIPVLAAEEILQVEKLRNSRNPNDFRTYIAERDKIMQERLKDRSDIYRYTVAEAMQKTRAKQASVFMSYVQKNREADRRAAAARAAKAAALRKKLSIEAASNMALAIGEDGAVTDDEYSEFVTSAKEKFGLTEAEAKTAYYNSIIDLADQTNDERLLKGIDLKTVPLEIRDKLLKAEDAVRRQRISVEDYNQKIGERERKYTAQVEKEQLNTAVREAMLNGATPAEMNAIALDTPMGQKDPKAAMNLVETYQGLHDASVDPATEAQLINDLEKQAENAAITGDFSTLDELVESLVAGRAVKSTNFEKLYSIRDSAKSMADDMVQEYLGGTYDMLEADFQPESIRQGEMTPLKALTPEAETFQRSVSERAKQLATRKFRLEVKRYSDQNNVDVRNIPIEALESMQSRVYQQTRRTVQATEDYKKLVEAYNASTGVSESTQEQLGDPAMPDRQTTRVDPSESRAALDALLKK